MTKEGDVSCTFAEYTLVIGDPIVISYGNTKVDIVAEVVGVAERRNGSNLLIAWAFGYIHSNSGFVPEDKHLIGVYSVDLCNIKFPQTLSKNEFQHNGKVYWV